MKDTDSIFLARDPQLGLSGWVARQGGARRPVVWRALGQVGLLAALVALFLLARQRPGSGGAALHTLLESLSALLALLVGLVAFVGYPARKDRRLLWIGTGFLGAAFLDGYHGMVTSSLFHQVWPWSRMLSVWTLETSAVFLAVPMCLVWWMPHQNRNGKRAPFREVVIYLLVVIGAVFLGATFLRTSAWGRAGEHVPGGGPAELLAGGLFAFALAGAWWRGNWKREAFEYCLLLALIIGVFWQLVVMPCSFVPYDTVFHMAHLLKLSSYACVFVGLLANTYYFLQHGERMTGRLQQTEAQARVVLQHTTDAIVTLDAQQIVTGWNRQAERMFGWKLHEARGRLRFTELVQLEPALQSCLESPEIPRQEGRSATTAVCRDGRHLLVEVSVSPLALPDARGFTAIIRDLTQQQLAAQRQAELQHQLTYSAQRAGMAEAATDVLHNVGNVMASINVSAGLVTERLQSNHVSNLRRAVQMLIENRDRLDAFLTGDERGRLLPTYLDQLAHCLADERAELLSELKSLRSRIEHVKEIVNLQQNGAKTTSRAEKVPLTDLIEEALQINGLAQQQNEIEVIRQFEDFRPLLIDKHRVTQILVNLISNARYALIESARDQKQLTVRVVRQGPTQILVQVQDNGVGIPAENLERIFTYGFTTRQAGHGFGLHSCALTARELGGQIRAHSDGPGQGALFTLQLPVPCQARSVVPSPRGCRIDDCVEQLV